jgi:hypothetical protein
MATEMEERVARALAFSAGGRIVGPGRSESTREFSWDGDGGHLQKYVEAHWKEHVHAATFAIEAIREPTEAMVEAGAKAAYGSFINPPNPWPNVHTHIEADGYREAYRAAHAAMIDAALKE